MAQLLIGRCIEDGSDYDPLMEFVGKYFDDAFRSIIDNLIVSYELEEARISDELFDDLEEQGS